MAIVGLEFYSILCILWSFNLVSAYYCEYDQCATDQYCCGDNLCCSYVYSLWYFWVGVVFIVIVISACGGLYKYCKSYRHSTVIVHRISTSYVPVPNSALPEDQYQFMQSGFDDKYGKMTRDEFDYCAKPAANSCQQDHHPSPPPPYNYYADSKQDYSSAYGSQRHYSHYP